MPLDDGAGDIGSLFLNLLLQQLVALNRMKATERGITGLRLGIPVIHVPISNAVEGLRALGVFFAGIAGLLIFPAGAEVEHDAGRGPILHGQHGDRGGDRLSVIAPSLASNNGLDPACQSFSSSQVTSKRQTLPLVSPA